MVNRIKRWLEEEDGFPSDYWVVSTWVGDIVVAADVAVRVVVALEQSDLDGWVEFEDLFGSSLRIRTRRIYAVFETTAEQRRKGRRFREERRRESDDDDRPWER